MKHAKACSQCRSTKRRCTQDPKNPDAACLACRKRMIECSKPWSGLRLLRGLPRTISNVRIAPSTKIPGHTSTEAIHEYVRLYFRYIHDRPHSLFHERSLWNAIDDGSLPESLLTAICALGCRFAAQTCQRGLSATFMQRSKFLLAQQLEDISVTNIQICILLANGYAAEQDNRLETLYFGIANRMAYVLGLHQYNQTDTLILRETKSRVWWSLFMADKWCPPGLGLPREMIRPDPTVDLPMDEVDFQQLQSGDVPGVYHRRKGIWAHKTTLVDILTSIQDVNLSLVRDEVDRLSLDHQVDIIASRLLCWHNSLPKHMVMNDENFENHRGNGQGGTFVALHFGYHHYSALLYFQYLDVNQEHTDQTTAYAARCSFHGLAFSRLLHTARQLEDCHVVYLTVAHMTIVSSSVLLHMLLFGDDAEVQVARTQLTRNFEALEDLGRYWPCVEQMKKRLFVFQDACLRSSAAKTFTVDKWIVRFLLEYGLPLEEKDSDGKRNETSAHDTVVSLERRAFLGEALESVHG